MAGRLMLNPWIYGRSGVPGMRRDPEWALYNPRRPRSRRRRRNSESWEALTSQEESDLYNLWQLSKVPTSHVARGTGRHRYARRSWAAGEMAKKHPRLSSTGFYKIYERRGMNPKRRRKTARNRKRRPGPKAYRRGWVMGRYGGMVKPTAADIALAQHVTGPYRSGYDRGFGQYLMATVPQHRRRRHAYGFELFNRGNARSKARTRRRSCRRRR